MKIKKGNMTYVNDYIMVQNLIPVELCKSLIRESEKLNWLKHSWASYGQGGQYSMKEKELEIVYSTEDQYKMVSKYLEEALHNYQQKYSTPGDKTGGSWTEHITPLRFNRYKVGMKMRSHYDHIHTLFDGELKGIPILSIVGLLNDNFEGAQFYCRGEEIKLMRGDILLFPSNFMYPHEVKETTKGIRYSFVGWAF